jgi:hypothetical protein
LRVITVSKKEFKFKETAYLNPHQKSSKDYQLEFKKLVFVQKIKPLNDIEAADLVLSTVYQKRKISEDDCLCVESASDYHIRM